MAISPREFEQRALEWQGAVKNTEFVHADYADVVRSSGSKDILYCDPPYVDSQKIIYGAQDFTLSRLFEDLLVAKQRGTFIALSIDGIKKSGNRRIDIDRPEGLFEQESFVALGGSMLKRFWRDGLTVDDEHVKDRLLILAESRIGQLSFL